ncbi:MAG: DUF6076 domain-containing protein [Clostridia bacterium]
MNNKINEISFTIDTQEHLEFIHDISFAYLEDKNKENDFTNIGIIDNLRDLKGYLSLNHRYVSINVGDSLIDFLSLDFNTFKDFFVFFANYYSYFISLLSKEDIKILDMDNIVPITDVIEIAQKYFDSESKKIEKIQYMFKEAVNFIYEIDEIHNLNSLNYKQRFFIYNKLKKGILRKEFSKFTSNNSLDYSYEDLSLISNYIEDTETLIDIVKAYDQKGTKISSSNYFTVTSPFNYFYISLFYLLGGKESIIKKCKNCNRYFVTFKNNVVFCDRLFIENKTCRDIGNSLSQKRKEQNDEVYKLYRNTLAKKKMAANRNPDISKYINDYETWKTQANTFRNEVLHGKKTDEEFKKWIENTR